MLAWDTTSVMMTVNSDHNTQYTWAGAIWRRGEFYNLCLYSNKTILTREVRSTLSCFYDGPWTISAKIFELMKYFLCDQLSKIGLLRCRTSTMIYDLLTLNRVLWSTARASHPLIIYSRKLSSKLRQACKLWLVLQNNSAHHYCNHHHRMSECCIDHLGRNMFLLKCIYHQHWNWFHLVFLKLKINPSSWS